MRDTTEPGTAQSLIKFETSVQAENLYDRINRMANHPFRNLSIHQQYFLGLLVLLLVSKALILFQFSFVYTGSDDLIFWQGTRDYLNGIWHEPYFYGQNYNFMLEAWLAVPLVALSIPYEIALPLSSVILGVFPFLCMALVLFRKGYQTGAYLFLALPVVLPIEYDLLTSVTRGFVNGLFFCGFLVLGLVAPTKRWAFIVVGLATSMGYVFNPNSVLLSLPILLYLFLVNYRNPFFYGILMISALPAGLLRYFAQRFYEVHPEFIVHSMWRLEYDFERMFEAFSNLDAFFRYLMPVFWAGNWMVLLLLLVLGIVVVRKDWRKGTALIVGALLPLFMLGLNKVHDHTTSVFFSSSRMFLALPLLLGLAGYWTFEVFPSRKLKASRILSLTLVVLLVKISVYNPVLRMHTQKTNYGPVAIHELDALKQTCADIKALTSEHHVDVIVYVARGDLNVPALEFYNYGCSFFEPEIPASVLNVYEKRTWVFAEQHDAVRERVLIFNPELPDSTVASLPVKYEILDKDRHLILVTNNTRTLQELSEVFRFDLRRNTY